MAFLAALGLIFLLAAVVVAVILLRRQDIDDVSLSGLLASVTQSVKQVNPDVQSRPAAAPGKPSSPAGSSSATKSNDTKPPIPSGHQIFLKGLTVTGAGRHKDAVQRLAAAATPSLFWKKTEDGGAISILGSVDGQEFSVGSVDKKTASKLAAWTGFDELNVRFEKAGFPQNKVELKYQVTGPKAQKKAFEEHVKG